MVHHYRRAVCGGGVRDGRDRHRCRGLAPLLRKPAAVRPPQHTVAHPHRRPDRHRTVRAFAAHRLRLRHREVETAQPALCLRQTDDADAPRLLCPARCGRSPQHGPGDAGTLRAHLLHHAPLLRPRAGQLQPLHLPCVAFARLRGADPRHHRLLHDVARAALLVPRFQRDAHPLRHTLCHYV